MAYSFPLERIYLATEFERGGRLSKRVVGTLLAGAFQAPPDDPDIDRLCAMLGHRPMAHHHGQAPGVQPIARVG